MKMGIMKKVLATTFATALVIGTFSGCGKETASIADDATPTSSAIDAKTVFTKGFASAMAIDENTLIIVSAP